MREPLKSLTREWLEPPPTTPETGTSPIPHLYEMLGNLQVSLVHLTRSFSYAQQRSLDHAARCKRYKLRYVPQPPLSESTAVKASMEHERAQTESHCPGLLRALDDSRDALEMTNQLCNRALTLTDRAATETRWTNDDDYAALSETRSVLLAVREVVNSCGQDPLVDNPQMTDESLPALLTYKKNELGQLFRVLRPLLERGESDVNPSVRSPKIRDLCTAAGISNDTFDRIRKKAGIIVGCRGGAAAKRIYSRDEVDRLIDAAVNGNFTEGYGIQRKWAKWSSKGAAKPQDRNEAAG